MRRSSAASANNLLFGPTSGAHFNPVVSAADWLLGRREGTGLAARDAAAYALAQIVGAILGAVLADAMFDLAPLQVAQKVRATPGLWLGEIVATAELLIFTLARTGRLSAAAVGAYIGAAYWFTSSTSFANPAVSIGRIFSDTFAGIAPASVPGFVVAQLIGAAPVQGWCVPAPHHRPIGRRRRDPPRRFDRSLISSHRPSSNGSFRIDLVVIGGSDAGISAGLHARELDPTCRVTLIVADAYPNFSICEIPYFISGDTGDSEGEQVEPV